MKDATGGHLHLKLDVDQVTGQGQAEQRHENSDKIDQESRRLELPGFQLIARPAVAKQTGERQQHSRKNGNGAEPDRKPRCLECTALQLHELADGNGETANRETEYDDRHARAHPRKKGALVRKVIAGAV